MLIPIEHLKAVCSFAADQQTTRQYLSSTYVEVSKDQVILVATDTVAMCIKQYSAAAISLDTPEGGYLIPAAAVAEVCKIRNKGNVLINIHIPGVNSPECDANIKYVSFEVEGWTYRHKLVDHRYPDFRRMLTSTVDEVGSMGFLSAYMDKVHKAAKIVQQDKNPIFHMFRDTKNNTVIIRTEDNSIIFIIAGISPDLECPEKLPEWI